jgi:hypothetical protein
MLAGQSAHSGPWIRKDLNHPEAPASVTSPPNRDQPIRRRGNVPVTREVGATPTVHLGIHPGKSRMVGAAQTDGAEVATNPRCQPAPNRIPDSRNRAVAVTPSIGPARRGRRRAAFLLEIDRNAARVGSEADVACVSGQVHGRRFRTPNQSGHARTPKRDSHNERQEEKPDEGCPGRRTRGTSEPRVTAVTSSHRSVTAAMNVKRRNRMKGALTTCLRQVMSSLREDRAPRGRRGRLTPWTPGTRRARPRPFDSRGGAPAERDRRRCARCAAGGMRRAWPSITCR